MRLTVNRILFLTLFMVPLMIVAFYEVFLATDRYESTASVIITEERSAGSEVDLTLLGIAGSSSDKDALVLKEFIESRGMLNFLNERLDLKSHFRQDKVDFIGRLGHDASLEDFHEYFLDFLTVEYDKESKILRFAFQSYDRQFTQQVVDTVLARSQNFIDRLNAEVTREQLRFFDDQIVKSEKRLREANDRLVEFQRENNILDTKAEAELVMATISELKKEVSVKKAELEARSDAISDKDAPQLAALRRVIKALNDEIEIEKKSLAGSDSLSSLSELDSKFREIQLGLEFTTNIYKANLSALEAARLEAARRLKFLIVVAKPTLADESKFPDRPYIIVSWAMVLLIVYFIISLMVAIVREHS